MIARVLLVDDDKGMCAWLEDALASKGFTTRTCTDGDEALGVLRAADVDVVVTDLNMQGMTGLELCERIAASRPDVPVIVLTGFGSLDTAVGAGHRLLLEVAHADDEIVADHLRRLLAEPLHDPAELGEPVSALAREIHLRAHE